MCKTGLRVLSLVLMFTAAGCSANVVVTKLEKDPKEKRKMDGFTYALPRTVVTVELPVKRTRLAPGKYAELADLFFPDLKALPAGDPSVKVGVERPAMKTEGEPDPNHVYFLEAQGKGTLKQSATFQLTEKGAITGLKAEVDNQLSDVILSGIGAVTGVVTRLGAAEQAGAQWEGCSNSDEPEELFAKFLADERLQENFRKLGASRVVALVAMCKPECRKPADTEPGSVVCTGPQATTLDEAKAAYDQIRKHQSRTKDLRETGTGSSVSFVVAERDKIVAEMIRRDFTGTAMPETWKGVFEVRPVKGTRTYPLLTLTSDKLCLDVDLRGAQAPPQSWIEASGCAGGTAVMVELTTDPEDQLATIVENNFTPPTGDNSVRYRIPVQVKAQVKAGHRVAGESRLMIAQYGPVVAVPSKMGGKAVAYDMSFWDSTGAVKSFTLTSSPMITKGAVDSLSASANAYLDARNKQRQAEAEAADLLNQLERQRKLLEHEKAIRDLCVELGKTDCPF